MVNVVSGSQVDQQYWHDQLHNTRKDVFRAYGETMVISSLEASRKGNFLGSMNAWLAIQKAMQGSTHLSVMLINIVFGEGKRLSPFTQALTNRKPAFPTPMCVSNGQVHLCSYV